MPSKDEITRLIRKRRKATLYRIVDSLAGLAVAHSDCPHQGYKYIPAKWIPQHVYRDWFEYAHYFGKYFKFKVEPKDHEWLLTQLLK